MISLLMGEKDMANMPLTLVLLPNITLPTWEVPKSSCRAAPGYSHPAGPISQGSVLLCPNPWLGGKPSWEGCPPAGHCQGQN